ncbi:MAG: sodium/proline symporter, partial [Bacteroidetes bacterium]|nr:sodium/proline symporter [Bacteroidota bacterium]
GAIVGFCIVLAYSFIGGFVAVVWSDFFQGLLMLLGLVALPVVAYLSYPGESLLADLHAIKPTYTSWLGEGGWSVTNIASIVALVAIGLGFLGSPQVFVRFISVKNEKEINKGRWVAFGFTLLADIGAILIGMYARAMFDGTEIGLGKNAEDSLIVMVKELMPAVLIGVYIAVVLSAIMSTIDSLLVVASSAITRDFYQKIFRPEIKQEKLANLSRWVTLIMALVGLAIAIIVALTNEDRTVFWFVIFGWTGIACTFCPVIVLALSWKRYNVSGAIASMITGFSSVIFFKFVMSNPKYVSANMATFFGSLEEMLPSFVLALIVGIIATLLTSSKKNSIQTTT